MQRALRMVNTFHYSFLEGDPFDAPEIDDANYRMTIHKLRIGTFMGLMGVFALILCV